MQARKFDIWLLGPVIILLIISFVTLLSLNVFFVRSQGIALAVSIISFFFFTKINVDFLKQLKLPIYIFSLVLLMIVLAVGIEARGASRWIEIFGVRLQFSEILKPFLCLSFASYVSENSEFTFKNFLKIFLFIMPIVLLITIQPDLGSGLLYASVALFTLLVLGFPLIWFVLTSIPFLAASPFIWRMLHGYQKQRILTFLNSSNDPLGTSYNGIQAVIAVGSGQFMGKGISEGTQSVLKFLPERHTDFIFATIAEGLGFVGASIIIVAFMLLLFRIYILFKDSSDAFSKVFFTSVFGFFLIQGFVNIGMNIGILPIVGITLPFVSFGGSSLLSNFIFLGIITSLTRANTNKQILEIK